MLYMEPKDSKYWKWAGVAFEFTVALGLFSYFGYLFDHHYATTPWGLVGGGAVGLVSGLYLLAKAGYAMMRNLDSTPGPEQDRPDDEPRPPE